VSGRQPLLLLLAVAAAVILGLSHRDEIRARAEAALSKGTPVRESELARGFVLGDDDRIDPATVEDFRRSGLSHLLAVSGQNVALLAMLAMPILAALGLALRARLLWVLGLIAVYVPLAGAGPSIVRAGTMGAIGVFATLAGRRAPRFHALLVAAIVTLAIDPGIASDVGWQLSFAAVLGILLLAAPLRRAILERIGSGGWRRPLAEGAAVTTAATLATAPLIAFHFEAISTTTLLANLLAFPAVAPAMSLGMLAAAGGQLPGFPVGVVNALDAPLLAYIAQVAAWCGRPSWAYLQVSLGLGGLIGSYAAIALFAAMALRWSRRRRLQALRAGRARRRRSSAHRLPRLGPALACAVAVAAIVWLSGVGRGASAEPPSSGLRIEVLDVGQGDAILLQPPGAAAVLVDGGPWGDGLAAKLRAEGVASLGAVIATHDQADHVGGIPELLGRMRIRALLYGVLGRRLLRTARAAGVALKRVAQGSELRSGDLRVDVIWPTTEALEERMPGEDPNRLAVVAVARWRDFSMLLTADAEAEATPLDPGPVDVLKVAHHGSEDDGLAGLLDRIDPKLAVISVGEDNPYGHPAPSTLRTLSEHHVPTLRTDSLGTVTLEVERGSIRVDSEN
jgi:competence protein ComEC